ncbi:MAG: amidohydrolase family protein [Acidobacteriaceae bacterium]|nr:amidohydrolase family protein [Acidobacteriaceae bacterium]
MSELLLLRGAKQLLTLRGPCCARRGSALRDLSVIEDGSVLIRDGRIVMVGPTRRLGNLKEVRGAAEISVEDMVVMPGLVDPGIRLSLLPEENGHRPLLKPKQIAELSFDCNRLLRSCLEHGTLTAQLTAHAGTGALRSDVMLLRRLAGVKLPPVRVTHAWRIDPSTASREPEYDFRRAFQSLRKAGAVRAVEIEPAGDASPSPIGPISAIAAEAGLAINSKFMADLPPIATPRNVFVSSDLAQQKCAALGASPCTAVFSPIRDLLEGRSGIAARHVADHGGAVALCTGYDPWYSPNFSMQLALSLAVLRLGLTPEEALTAATINAACAIGEENSVGTLESGKYADLLVMNVSDYRDIPSHLGINKVLWAMRGGKLVVDNRTASKVRSS